MREERWVAGPTAPLFNYLIQSNNLCAAKPQTGAFEGMPLQQKFTKRTIIRLATTAI
jgi:hypothetical protein